MAATHPHTGETRRERARRESEKARGWLNFAAAYLVAAGMMTLIWGVVALANKQAFTEDGLVWSKLETWGWIAIVVGGAEILAAWLVVQRKFAGQWLAGVLAGLSLLVHFLALGAYPVWSVIAIVTNGLVVWAITTHGDEFE
jgi:hypothetical protein